MNKITDFDTREILEKIVDLGCLVECKGFSDYLFLHVSGKFRVYNTEFYPSEVREIKISEDNGIQIVLKVV